MPHLKEFLARMNAWPLRTKIVAGGAFVVILGGIYFFSGSGTVPQQVTVTRGTIVERVDVTGQTTPVGTVSLAFETSGTIAYAPKKVGDRAVRGETIAALDTRDLSAQRAEAEANADAARAKLASVLAGSRSEDIAVSEAALTKAKQDLANDYANAADTLADSYAKASEAVRIKLNVYFTDPDGANPKISFDSNDAQATNAAEQERVQSGAALDAWKTEIAGLSAASAPEDIATALARAVAHMSVIRIFLGDLYAVAVSGASETVKTTVTASVNEANTALTNVNGARQTIAAEEIVVNQRSADLALTKAPATAENLATERAAVRQAEASAEASRARLAKAYLSSPIAGVISLQEAKTGQIASAGVPVVTVISDNDLQIEAYLSEVDVTKVSAGDAVTATFDAIPRETFPGTVSFVDPAETVQEGVVGYKVTVILAAPDPRIKSGLTANLSITTDEKEGVLILPQFAILQTDAGSFVRKMIAGITTDTPVITGIRDNDGNVEIISGVMEGDIVLNIGLKAGG